MTGKRFDGKVAAVTGGASGIGWAIARRFAGEGASVAILDIKDADTAAKELGEHAVGVQVDVSDAESIRDAIAAVAQRWGRLDVLVNNAGIDGAIAPVADYPIEDFDRVVAVNLRACFLGMKYAIPHLLQTRGSIVNISSGGAWKNPAMLSGYCATKAGVISMTKVVAVEYAASGVRVNTVLPGSVDTPMLQKVFEESRELEAQMLSAHPVGRLGAPEDIAASVAFLASDESGFITGTALTTDGGYTST